MTGLVPVIHETHARRKAWVPGPSPGTTTKMRSNAIASIAEIAQPD